MDSIKGAMEKAGKKVQEIVRTNMVLRVPPIKKVETTAEKQEIIAEAVARWRQYLAEIPGHMAELVSRIRKIQGAPSPEERALCSRELRALEEEVLAHLNSEEELLRNAAIQAYALAMVATLPLDKRAVVGTIQGENHSRLPGLVEVRILAPVDREKVKDDVSVVKVYGDTYKVGGNRDFATKLAETLSAGAANAAKAAHERYHGQVAVLKARVTLSIAETYEGKSGCLFLEVPDKREGDKFFSGGALLMVSDGKKVEVLQAVGHFQKVLEEIRDAGVGVTVESLKSGKIGDYIPDKEEYRRTKTLHAILCRGLAEAQAQAEKEVVKKRLENLSS